LIDTSEAVNQHVCRPVCRPHQQTLSRTGVGRCLAAAPYAIHCCLRSSGPDADKLCCKQRLQLSSKTVPSSPYKSTLAAECLRWHNTVATHAQHVALLGFCCLGWRWGDPSASYIVIPSCVFTVSSQEILLPPRFRALSHMHNTLLLSHRRPMWQHNSGAVALPLYPTRRLYVCFLCCHTRRLCERLLQGGKLWGGYRGVPACFLCTPWGLRVEWVGGVIGLQQSPSCCGQWALGNSVVAKYLGWKLSFVQHLAWSQLGRCCNILLCCTTHVGE
jgi:hypothetical protein